MGKIKKQRNIVKELRQKKSSTIPNSQGKSISLDRNNYQEDFNPEDIVYKDPTGKNVSDTLLKYASPFIGGLSGEELKRMLMIVIMAWNISLSPEEQRAEQVTAMLKDVTADNSQAFERGVTLMNYMIKCKDDLYPEYKYYIQDYNFSIIDGEPYLAVVSEAR